MTQYNTCNCGTCPSCLQSCENGPVDTINSGKFIRVSDRNGNPRNLINKEKSIVTSDGFSINHSDGSIERPIILSLQELGAAKSVLAASQEGLVGVMTPTGLVNLKFGYWNGSLGFKIDGQDNPTFLSSQIGEVSQGSLIVLECIGNNLLQLAKLSLKCDGRRYAVIENGQVTCDDKLVTECTEDSDVEQLDSISGCLDGTRSAITPTPGQILIGSDTTPSQWVAQDNRSAKVLLADPFVVGQLNVGFAATISITTGGPPAMDPTVTSGNSSGTVNMLTSFGASGYTTGRTIAWIDVRQMVNATAIALESITQLLIAGKIVHESAIDGCNCGFKNDKVIPIALVNDEFTYEIKAYAQNNTQCQAWTKLMIIGWE